MLSTQEIVIFSTPSPSTLGSTVNLLGQRWILWFALHLYVALGSVVVLDLRMVKKAPCKVHGWCDAVVDGNMVYVVAGGSVKTYFYDITSDNWCQLPDCVHVSGSITVINGLLTAVGGGHYPYSDELFSLTGEGSWLRRWTKQFPPMPTKRKSTTALCSGIALFVIGEDEKGLSVVEVMNTA